MNLKETNKNLNPEIKKELKKSKLKVLTCENDFLVVPRGHQFLFAQAYGATHPYGRDVAGRLEAVARLDHAKLTDFNKRFYHPERVLLVVDGDVDASVLDRLIEKEWSNWKVDGPAAQMTQRPKAADQNSTKLMRAQVAQAHFGLAFSLDNLNIAQRAELHAPDSRPNKHRHLLARGEQL